MRDKFLALDLGTSSARSYVIDQKGKVLGKYSVKWVIKKNREYFFMAEYDLNRLKNLIPRLIKGALSVSKTDPTEIAGICGTGQRLGGVIYGKEMKEIYIGPDFDSRGVMVENYPNEESLNEIYNETGHYPPFLYMPMRLLWFKENEPELYRKVKAISGFTEWIFFKLTGKLVGDVASASELSLFNYKNLKWSKKALDTFDLKEEFLPEIKKAGDVEGEVSKEASQSTGLMEGTPVTVCTVDTHLALLSTGLFKGTGVVAGHTMPCLSITNFPPVDPEMKTWLGPYAFGGYYSESNAGITGGLIDWFVEGFLKIKDYKKFERLFLRSPIGSKGVYFKVSENPTDIKKLAEQKMESLIVFPNPSVPFLENPGIEGFARSIVEYIAFSMRANIEEVEGVTKEKGEVIRLTGGITKLTGFLKIVADVTGRELLVNRMSEGTLQGMLILLLVSSGKYSSLKDALASIADLNNVKQSRFSEKYEEYYKNFISLNSLYSQL